MSQLALSDSFDYLCYGSMSIRNIFTLSVWGGLYTSESDVCRRQILMAKVDPRPVRVNIGGFTLPGINPQKLAEKMGVFYLTANIKRTTIFYFSSIYKVIYLKPHGLSCIAFIQ